MKIVKPSRIRQWAAEHGRAKSSLEAWLVIARRAKWASFVEVRQTYRSADAVTVASGKTVIVFNIGGNRYRMICALHPNRERVFLLLFLTHAEYSKGDWKETL